MLIRMTGINDYFGGWGPICRTTGCIAASYCSRLEERTPKAEERIPKAPEASRSLADLLWLITCSGLSGHRADF